MLLLTALVLFGGLSWKACAVFGIALTLAGAYWEWNEGRNVSALPQALSLHTVLTEERIPVQAEGVIISPVERDGDRVDFTVRLIDVSQTDSMEQQNDDIGEDADNKETEGTEADTIHGEKIQVQVKLQAETEIAEAADWSRGDTVELNGELVQPSEARNFGGFDYRAYLLTNKIHWLLKVDGTGQVHAKTSSGWIPAAVLRWNDRARLSMGAELDRLFAEPDAGYLKGLVIGMQDDLDPDTYKQFSQLGLTHILAISGMHVAVFVGVLLFIMLRLRMTKETALTVVLFLVPVYVLLSGAGPSVIRAGIMAMIALYAARQGILKDGLNILSASALLMLVWNPYFLLSVSFQLSFLVTAGLMVYVPLAAPLLSSCPRWLGSTIAVTLVAQLISFPMTIYYFNQFSLLSFAANFVLVPLITFVVLPLGTGALLVGRLWDGAANILVKATEWLNHITFAAVEWMNGWTAGVLIWRSPSLVWISAYYILLYGLFYVLHRRHSARNMPLYMDDETRPLDEIQYSLPGGRIPSKTRSSAYVNRFSLPLWCSRWTVFLLGMCFIFLLLAGYRPENPRGVGTISYLDVGQGDSILITTPGGANILVDGGGTVDFGSKEEWQIRRSPFEIGEKVLLPLLKKRGIHRLDAVILTHGDQDHAGGLQAVLEGLPVSALLFNGTMVDSETYATLMRTALDHNVKLYGVHQGMAVAPDEDTILTFLWPEENAPGIDTDVAFRDMQSDAAETLINEQPAVKNPVTGETTLTGTMTMTQVLPPIVKEQNHESVVFRLDMDGGSFLFTGDMDLAAEEEITRKSLESGIAQNNRIDMLKVAHHGSKTSTGQSWLDYWKPTSAVISAGVNNLYGHPNQQVLERLNADDIGIWRTDQQGEIQVRVDGGVIQVRHMLE